MIGKRDRFWGGSERKQSAYYIVLC